MTNMSLELLLQIFNMILIPAIVYIVGELKKLDNRVFDLQKSVLTRTEYFEEIRAIHEELRHSK